MDIITLYLLLGVASGVLHPAQGCKILVITHQGFVSPNLDMIQFSYITGGGVQTGIQEEKKLFC